MAEWFRPKRVGIGYTPTGFFGWGATLAVALVIFTAWKLLKVPHAPVPLRFWIITGVAVAAYALLAIRTGRPR